jgi:predicted Fe-Mo cluster-binding NifX family protein
LVLKVCVPGFRVKHHERGFSIVRIAIPLAGGVLTEHFGHCEKFALVDAEPNTSEITAITEVEAPEHQPGLLPRWLKERGVNLVIAGGMGNRAQTLFEAASIEVITGAPVDSASSLVRHYMAGTLVKGPNSCSH